MSPMRPEWLWCRCLFWAVRKLFGGDFAGYRMCCRPDLGVWIAPGVSNYILFRPRNDRHGRMENQYAPVAHETSTGVLWSHDVLPLRAMVFAEESVGWRYDKV
jgi:hypothetical protein